MLPTQTAKPDVAKGRRRRSLDRSEHGHADLVQRLRVAHLEMLDAVVDGEGLARVAAIAGRIVGGDVAIVAPRLGPPAVSAAGMSEPELAALTRYVADRLRDRPASVPASVVREVAITTGDELVGLVALVSTPDRAGLAYATEVLYLAAAAAQARIAIEDARHEVEEGLRDTFLEELRSQVPLSRGHITRRAVRLGCDITHGAVALCAHGDPERPRRMMATIASVVPAALTQAFDGCIYAVLPAVDADDPAEATLALAESVAARLRSYGPVGVSSFYADPAELRSALDEAELMADFLQGPGTPPADVVGRGSYRLLLRLYVSHPEDVWIFYDSTLAPLVGYDDQYGTELVATLESYLGHDCNMNATAAAVFAHRHTIAYRLERVRELTGLDPGRCEDRERLGLGLKAYRILIPRAHLRGSVGPAEPAGN